jgi:2-amino-4-hydroxy-6-hydroxymethyldihydropteridine diphosphokinase
LIKRSSWYETSPVGLADPEWFINGVFLLETDWQPRQLLEKVGEVEQALGRQRTGKWGPRTLALDILLYDDRIIREPDLSIPHPELEKRRFVLEPLAEIAPDLVHPVFKKTVAEMKQALKDQGQQIKKVV